MDEETAWRLLEDLLTAVNAAHRASIVHLDIKPANVLLDGARGFVLADFGVSRGSREAAGAHGHAAATPGFQAPEQGDPFGAGEIDTRTDLWGVGVTVWAMLMGDAAWVAPATTYGEDREGLALPRLSLFRPGLDPTLESIVMSMLCTDPINRPGGAAEVLAAIRSREGGGADAEEISPPGQAATREEADEVLRGLVDPLWATLCRRGDLIGRIVRHEDGATLGREGEDSYHTFLLLGGTVTVELGGRIIETESREGTFLGEISTLTGQRRTATMRADGTVWTCTFNAAELERLVATNPAVAVRMVRSLAHRLQMERTGN